MNETSRPAGLRGLCGSPACSRAIPIRAATSAYPPDYVGLLKTYVTPEGVRYAVWHANKADVERLKKIAVVLHQRHHPPTGTRRSPGISTPTMQES